MTRTIKTLLLFGLFHAFSAEAAVIFATDCDNGTAYIIDTSAATFTSHAQTNNTGCAIAVTDRVVVSDYPDSGVVEYDLSFTPTGNTWPGSSQWSQMLDGTTDGTNNYVSSWSSIGVVITDANFQNGAVLFNPPFSTIGITYDPTDGTIWLVNDDATTIHHYDVNGTELGSFDAALPGRDCCLSYDPADDTLWIGLNSDNTLYQFDKTGTQLDSVTIAGWAPSNQWGAEIGGAAVDVPGTGLFKVTKTFSDGREDEVDVTLTCNGGLPLVQDFTIAGGGPGVTFVVNDIPDTGVTCTVTESGSPDGYTPVMNGGTGCSWTNFTGGLRNCVISNEADPGMFTVNKDWVIPTVGGEDFDDNVAVTIWCDAEISPYTDEDDGDWYYMTYLGDGDSATVSVDTTTGDASCWAVEDLGDITGVEASDDCGSQSVSAGEEVSCTFTNTLFFEGIPTLSQYGLAILVLLTLGVGMVGFRRFA